ncbi:hypothetical protein [Streptomyces sp. NBC_01465]|uniref:hypothetical protein n=1 Tax=Streptomyces sp. NBC_01465 TaxID=2903878 RepID=UPI002E2FF884|nr:hypothetical protein [Streptomyces sp. NBC_01465]
MRTLFRYLLEEREWRSHEAFLPQFRQAANRINLPGIEPAQTTFEAWFYGARRPQRDARRVLVELLGYSIDALWSEIPDGTAPAIPALNSAPPATPAELGGDLTEMKRMGVMAARRAKDFVLGTERERVGAEAIGFVNDEVTRLVAEYPRVPLATIWDDLASAQDDVFRLLEGGRLRPSQLRDLNFQATVLSFLMAKGSNDMGDPKTAMVQARVALSCADDAEHPGLIALVNGLKSLIAYWANQPEDALHFARQGAAHANPQRGTVGLWMLGLEARAAALLGDEATVRTANRAATERRDRVTPDDLDALGGLLTYPDAKQHYYTVEAEVLLGHGGEPLATQAAKAVQGFSDPNAPEWAFGDLAGAQCNQALTYLYGGDLDGAASAIRPVLDLPASLRNQGIVVSAARVRQALTAGTARDAIIARDLAEEIAAYKPQRLALPR